MKSTQVVNRKSIKKVSIFISKFNKESKPTKYINQTVMYRNLTKPNIDTDQENINTDLLYHQGAQIINS